MTEVAGTSGDDGDGLTAVEAAASALQPRGRCPRR